VKNKEPEKINIENNSLGIDFSKSKKIKRYFDQNEFLWSKETTPGPVIGEVATLYTTSKRAMDSIKLEEQKILIDLEKKTKIKLNSLDVQIQNSQQ
tara:strand:+ start:645 stop:932 length:288 start_codon:yes stop_codon:yes gene_type:complete